MTLVRHRRHVAHPPNPSTRPTNVTVPYFEQEQRSHLEQAEQAEQQTREADALYFQRQAQDDARNTLEYRERVQETKQDAVRFRELAQEAEQREQEYRQKAREAESRVHELHGQSPADHEEDAQHYRETAVDLRRHADDEATRIRDSGVFRAVAEAQDNFFVAQSREQAYRSLSQIFGDPPPPQEGGGSRVVVVDHAAVEGAVRQLRQVAQHAQADLDSAREARLKLDTAAEGQSARASQFSLLQVEQASQRTLNAVREILRDLGEVNHDVAALDQRMAAALTAAAPGYH